MEKQTYEPSVLEISNAVGRCMRLCIVKKYHIKDATVDEFDPEVGITPEYSEQPFQCLQHQMLGFWSCQQVKPIAGFIGRIPQAPDPSQQCEGKLNQTRTVAVSSLDCSCVATSMGPCPTARDVLKESMWLSSPDTRLFRGQKVDSF